MEARCNPSLIDPCCGGLQSAPEGPERNEDWILPFIGDINISDWSEMNMTPFHDHRPWNDIKEYDSILSSISLCETVDMESTCGEAFHSEQQAHSLSRISRPWDDIMGLPRRPPTLEFSVLSSVSPCDSVPSSEFYACNYNLLCEFEFLGSQVHFGRDSYEEWMTHTVSHFEHYTLAPSPSGLYFGESLSSLHTLSDIESTNSTSHSPTRRLSLGKSSPYLTNRNNGDFRQGGSYCSKCGDFFKDLKAHLLVHQFKRRQKCPIQACDGKARSFTGKYNVDRHLLNRHKRTTCLKSSEGCGKMAEMSFSDAFDYSNQSFDVDLNKLILHCSRHELGQLEEDKYSQGNSQKSILVKQKFMAEWDGRMICKVTSLPVRLQFLQFVNISMGVLFSFLASTLFLWIGSSPRGAKSCIRVLAVCRLAAAPL